MDETDTLDAELYRSLRARMMAITAPPAPFPRDLYLGSAAYACYERGLLREHVPSDTPKGSHFPFRVARVLLSPDLAPWDAINAEEARRG
jgi:hypothetical protein